MSDHVTHSVARRHAVVIGGSIAGLLAARVLADHFETVTVLERDRYPDGPHSRNGVPQAHHLHALLLRGQQVMEELFPGLCDELRAAGAQDLDTAADLAWLTPAGWAARFPSDLQALAFSRDLLDWCVRRRVTALRRVRVVQGADVTGLLLDGAGTAVGGVVTRRRGRGDDESCRSACGNLIVDASGRGSRAPDWLEALGYPRPEETVVNAFLGYASRFFTPPPEFRSHWKGLFVQAAPPGRKRGGILVPVEGGRWLVTLIGGGRDYPPTDEAGFLEFARSLPTPLLYEALRAARPLTPVVGHRGTENRLRRYDRLPRRPERFLVLGDAACAFNPVYGQGMTIAALGARELGRCLVEQQRCPTGYLAGLADRFQQRLAAINATPWLLATSEDLRYREAVGGRAGWRTRFLHAYLTHVLRLGTRCAAMRRRFLEVNHALRSPATLFSPGVLCRVAWQAAFGPRSPGQPPIRPPSHGRLRVDGLSACTRAGDAENR